jgi:hypothetical protein
MIRHLGAIIAMVAALSVTACSSDSGDGGSGGSGGSGGTAGAGGMGGSGGDAGGGGAAGTGGSGGGGANSAPEATIVVPASDSGTDNPSYVYDGFDSDLGLWYLDVDLEGMGVDAEDGTLTGSSLVWKTNQTEIQDATLGSGTNATVRLYSDDCFGVEHVITLEATDSGGSTTVSEPRRLVIWTLC